MKLHQATSVSLLALASSSAASAAILALPATQSGPFSVTETADVHLDERQITAFPTYTTPSPVTVTTYWVETTLGGTYSTWVPVTYVQTFAPVLDQWPLPGIGSIGLGTLTKEKRQAAQSTEYMIPLEMSLQTRKVVIPLHQYQQVEIVEPVTVLSYSFSNKEQPSTTPSATLPVYSLVRSVSVNEGSWINATRPVSALSGYRPSGTASSRIVTGTAARSQNSTASSGFLARTRSVLFLHDGVPTAEANVSVPLVIDTPFNSTSFLYGM